jgi:hypothetical protein
MDVWLFGRDWSRVGCLIALLEILIHSALAVVECDVNTFIVHSSQMDSSREREKKTSRIVRK